MAVATSLHLNVAAIAGTAKDREKNNIACNYYKTIAPLTLHINPENLYAKDKFNTEISQIQTNPKLAYIG